RVAAESAQVLNAGSAPNVIQGTALTTAAGPGGIEGIGNGAVAARAAAAASGRVSARGGTGHGESGTAENAAALTTAARAAAVAAETACGRVAAHGAIGHGE